MKELIALTISLFILPKLTGQEPTLKPYGIKSGIIEYTYSGDKTGKGTLYFDDYGTKSAMYAETVSYGEATKGWVVSYGDYQYMWDPSSGEGMKMQNPLITWIKESSKEDIESFTEATYSQMGMVKSGTEMFLGKECNVIKGNMGRVLIWNGILMMMDIKMGAYESGQKATSIKTNIPVEAKYFILPENIKFSEMPTF